MKTPEAPAKEIALSRQTARELAYRENDGLAVSLLWYPAENSVHVRVDDDKVGESLEFDVQRGKALDAFHHPYAYAAMQDVAASTALALIGRTSDS